MKVTTHTKPVLLVIFGITGDLAQRKLLPALYHLLQDGLIDPRTRIVGITRREITSDEVINPNTLCGLSEGGVCDPQALEQLRGMVQMHQMDLVDGAGYDGLRTFLDELEGKNGCMARLFYLSIPPNVFAPIVKNLGERGLAAGCGHGEPARLLVEKPFGYDLASARELIAETGRQFAEEQIFRIDHYLAKETAQNILAFRFENPVFESIWDAKHIERIEILAAEQIGIEGRGIFYEQTGALRDVMQSHLLQLLALVTMERPNGASDASVHAARLKLFKAIEPLPPREAWRGLVVRGQYEGYALEAGNERSFVETFAALELRVHNARWRGVPIRIMTGKALAEKQTRIDVFFRAAPHDRAHVGARSPASASGTADAARPGNRLTFHIQPREGISIDLNVKRPGFERAIETVEMDFRYERSFDRHGHPDAYERVLVDAFRGDRTLFASSAEVLASWRVLDPLVAAWAESPDGLELYRPGSSGPHLPWLATDQ